MPTPNPRQTALLIFLQFGDKAGLRHARDGRAARGMAIVEL